MADPITITTTFITLATFIKDLIEVGQSIKRSIEKVAENRRCIRELTDDVLHTLADLANLTRGQEDIFQAPALSSALGDLKANMIYVHSTCLKIRPVQRGPGLRGLGSQIMIWMKRDDVEGKIRRLKEHVNKCYLQFAVFAVARIEQRTARIEDTSLSTANTTLRLEQTLMVNQVENQVRWRQVEVLMARMLLETEFGENIMNQTIEIISSVGFTNSRMLPHFTFVEGSHTPVSRIPVSFDRSLVLGQYLPEVGCEPNFRSRS
ncbi:hypothetical protein K438DRAFT_451347 [Mycena galopus ATCC 62051]|nr:hypothetical protein K438DRAFT_451347 [Mycena galopus ATCC 62051]